VIGGMVDDTPSGPPFAIESDQDPLGTEGKSPWAYRESFKLPWNDIGRLEEVLAKYGQEVALILMEPIMCNAGACHPRPGYLERVRELCNQYGILLSFDEIITGFRVGLEGAQGMLGVTPDLATFGKALGGGLPISVVAGKKEVMDLLAERRVIGAGTFNGYPIGVTAALCTLSILEQNDGEFYQKVDWLQERLQHGLHEIASRRNRPIFLQGTRGVFFQLFSDKTEVFSVRDLKDQDVEKQNRFRSLLIEEGVLIMWGGRWYVCGGLTVEDVDFALEKADRAMGRL
jgi:glutamate-1-semialdehyde 2,1-aminomutase